MRGAFLKESLEEISKKLLISDFLMEFLEQYLQESVEGFPREFQERFL